MKTAWIALLLCGPFWQEGSETPQDSDRKKVDQYRRELEAIKDVDDEHRGARFQCVMVYLRHANDPTPRIFQGTWEGAILHEPRGDKGFGYDPVFFVPEKQCSSAELAPEVKNSLSHRGQALRKLIASLRHN